MQAPAIRLPPVTSASRQKSAPDLGCVGPSAGAGVVRFQNEGKHVTMAEDQGAPLPGAGLGDRGLVRIGHTVRRPAGLWTSSVHDLLRYLPRSGFDAVPEPLGVDSAGREVLTYLPGRDQGWPFHACSLDRATEPSLERIARHGRSRSPLGQTSLADRTIRRPLFGTTGRRDGRASS